MFVQGIFSNEVTVRYAHGPSSELRKDLWIIDNGFKFEFWCNGSKFSVTVPKGYLSDGGSIPRPLWQFAPSQGRYTQSVILHDWLCETLTITSEASGDSVRILRKQADEILRLAMQTHKVSRFHKFLIYYGVRIYALLTRVNTPQLDSAKRAFEKR